MIGEWQGLAGEVTRAGRFHLAATLARGLVAVWVKAMGDITAAGAARGVSPPPPWAWLRLPVDTGAGTRAPCQDTPTMQLVHSHGSLYTPTVPCICTWPLVPSQCQPHSAPCTPTVPLLHPQYHLIVHSDPCILTTALAQPLCSFRAPPAVGTPTTALAHALCPLHTHPASYAHPPLTPSRAPSVPPSVPLTPGALWPPRQMHVPHSVTNRCWQRVPKVPGGQ